jgi:ring-1,2-phenylacetyl-CoA epoxidase subunit PaaE
MNTTEYHALKISKKSWVHNKYWLISLAIPEGLVSFFDFRAGQSVPIRLQIDHTWQTRYFSLCQAPNEGLDLSLMININPKSNFGQTLHTHLLTHDVLDIGAPMGNFCLDSKPNEQRHLLAMAAGVGIAPILSHAAYHLSQEPGSSFSLCYGLKTPESNFSKSAIEVLQMRFGERFKVHYFYSQWPETSLFHQGRLDQKKLKLIANQLLEWDEVDTLLLCGPQEMMQNIANAALKMGMPAAHIHYESFSNQRLILKDRQQIPYLENIQLSYTYQQKTHQTTLANNQLSIAQQLINQGLPVPYSCKSGVCGTCQCQVVAGKVKITDNEYLTDTELQKGQRLACTSYALEPYINLDFDCF